MHFSGPLKVFRMFCGFFVFWPVFVYTTRGTRQKNTSIYIWGPPYCISVAICLYERNDFVWMCAQNALLHIIKREQVWYISFRTGERTKERKKERVCWPKCVGPVCARDIMLSLFSVCIFSVYVCSREAFLHVILVWKLAALLLSKQCCHFKGALWKYWISKRYKSI